MTRLHWTGHALVDVGIAGLCALAEKRQPEDLTGDDLDRASEFMERHYYGGALGTYLSCVFMNASFVQPKEGKEKTAAFIAQYLRAHRSAPDPRVRGTRCAFSGEPATSALVRTHLPMFSGEDVMNFRPNGETFVPAAGAYVVALMMLPMASRRAEGRLLAVIADEPLLTLRFARRYLDDNQRLLALPLPTVRAPMHPGYDREQPQWDSQKKQYKFADVKGPRSLLVHDLTSIAAEALPSDLRPRPVALAAYLLSSSGQGPSLEIFHVPSGVVSFVAQAAGASTASAWKAISARYWPLSGEDGDSGRVAARKRTKPKGARTPGRAGWSKNPAFEELCAIFHAGYTDRRLAAGWLRKHVLGRLERDGARATYRRGDAWSWKLADLFLREVLGMRNGRIQTIRSFADKLAGWIVAKTDKRLFNALIYDRLADLRHALLRVQRQSASGELLFGLDEYRDVWLHDDGDAYLVRDLLCIRVVEQLHERGYFTAHPEDVIDASGPADDAVAAREEASA